MLKPKITSLPQPSDILALLPLRRSMSAGLCCAMYPDLATHSLCPGSSWASVMGDTLAEGTRPLLRSRRQLTQNLSTVLSTCSEVL